MLGIVAEGLFKGGSLEREQDGKAMFIQLSDGRKIPINNNTAISAKSEETPPAYDCAKTVRIIWKNGEYSLVLIGVKNITAKSERVMQREADSGASTPQRRPASTSSRTGIPSNGQVVASSTSTQSAQSRTRSTAPSTPVFTPPSAPSSARSTSSAVPVFTPPTTQSNTRNANPSVPVFTPPTNQRDTQSNSYSAPGFTPPAAPKFTPPAAPKFTPPAAPRFTGPACHFHPDEPAAHRCARCGKYICQDCAENYQVTNNQYEGQPICYDCCQELVSENVSELKKNLTKIKVAFITSLVGMLIGLIFGFTVGVKDGGFGSGVFTGLVFACIGGVFFSAAKQFFALAWHTVKTIFTGDDGDAKAASIVFIFQVFLILPIKCIWATVRNTIQYIIYIRRTSGFIESDTEFLRQISDYMEYTLVRNKYQGVDIDTLLENESSLANNSFARMVQAEGEEQAEANLRGVTALVNEHGEIIRNFAA